MLMTLNLASLPLHNISLLVWNYFDSNKCQPLYYCIMVELTIACCSQTAMVMYFLFPMYLYLYKCTYVVRIAFQLYRIRIFLIIKYRIFVLALFKGFANISITYYTILVTVWMWNWKHGGLMAWSICNVNELANRLVLRWLFTRMPTH